VLVVPALSIFGAAGAVWCLLGFLSPSLELLVQIPETTCLFCFEAGFGGMTETACKYRRTLVANWLPSSAPPLSYLLSSIFATFPILYVWEAATTFLATFFLSSMFGKQHLFFCQLSSPLLSLLPMMKLSNSRNYLGY